MSAGFGVMHARRSLLAMAALIILVGTGRGDELAVGSKAPAIDIEHWMQTADRDGDFKPITDLEAGTIYVIEFWATWCPPCRASMPHLAELQERFADKGVAIISVSDEDLETVEQFLESKADGDRTYGEITAGYLLATDPDGSVSEDYMKASGQRGIPTAFVVGRTGEIEWIGHPMQMDRPLAEIVAGTFDREAAAAAAREMEAMQDRFHEVVDLMQAGKAAEAVDLLDRWLAEIRSPEVRERVTEIRGRIALRAGGERSATAFAEAVARAGDAAGKLNELAWAVVQAIEAGTAMPDDLVAAATKAAEKSVALEPDNGAHLDTLAHLLALRGDLDAALAAQRKALEHASGDTRKPIQGYLDELEAKAALQTGEVRTVPPKDAAGGSR